MNSRENWGHAGHPGYGSSDYGYAQSPGHHENYSHGRRENFENPYGRGQEGSYGREGYYGTQGSYHSGRGQESRDYRSGQNYDRQRYDMNQGHGGYDRGPRHQDNRGPEYMGGYGNPGYYGREEGYSNRGYYQGGSQRGGYGYNSQDFHDFRDPGNRGYRDEDEQWGRGYTRGNMGYGEGRGNMGGYGMNNDRESRDMRDDRGYDDFDYRDDYYNPRRRR